MNFWTDTHAHIYSEDFIEDFTEVMERCEAGNIQKILMPNVDYCSIDRMMEIESKDPKRCYAMMGLHSCSVKKDFERELYKVEDWLSKRKFCAVGEIGTDLYWDKTFWEQQKEAFTIQLNWAKKYKLPVVIHCRESIDQTIELVEQLHDEKLTGVFHCFTGTLEQAKKIMALGFYLGIGGVATFKNGGLDNVISEMEPSKILLETDSPYLAPVPHRGKRNEPSYIPIVAQKIASLRNVAVEELQKITTQNALALFSVQKHD